MKKKVFVLFLIILIISIFFTIISFATDNNPISDDETSEYVDEEESGDTAETLPENSGTATYKPQSSSSSYVTSVSPLASNYESNLSLNNILCILLISIGLLLVLLSIAILIRIKR